MSHAVSDIAVEVALKAESSLPATALPKLIISQKLELAFVTAADSGIITGSPYLEHNLVVSNCAFLRVLKGSLPLVLLDCFGEGGHQSPHRGVLFAEDPLVAVLEDVAADVHLRLAAFCARVVRLAFRIAPWRKSSQVYWLTSLGSLNSPCWAFHLLRRASVVCLRVD